MKKIDKNSTVVKSIRFGAEFLSNVGAGIAVESALIPFVTILWKSKPVRVAGYFGSFALACGAGSFAAGTIDDVIDLYIDFYNDLADAVNGETSESTDFELVRDIPADKISACKTSREQISNVAPEDPLTDAVANSKIFEFKHEEDAKTLIQHMDVMYNSASILDFAMTRKSVEPSWGKEYFDKIDIPEANIYGWNSFKGVEIEQINDDLFFADLLDYDILPEKVNYYKDSDMNHMVPKED